MVDSLSIKRYIDLFSKVIHWRRLFVNVVSSVVSLVALTRLLFFELQKGCYSQLGTAFTKMQNGKRNTSVGGIKN